MCGERDFLSLAAPACETLRLPMPDFRLERLGASGVVILRLNGMVAFTSAGALT